MCRLRLRTYTEFDMLGGERGVNHPVSARQQRAGQESETSIGSLVADAFRTTMNADLAFVSAGDLKATSESIASGKLQSSVLGAVLAYPDEPLVVLALDGRKIREALERSVSSYPRPGLGFLQVSGCRIVFDPARTEGDRIISISVAGKPIVDEQAYTVAMPSSLAGGALGYWKVWSKRNIVSKQVDSVICTNAIDRYFRANPKLDYAILNRVTVAKVDANRGMPRGDRLSAPRIVVLIVLSSLLLSLTLGCSPSADVAKDIPAFDGGKAYDLLKRQVDIGPRYPGVPGHDACGDLIIGQLKPYANVVETQDFRETVAGKDLALRNIIAKFNTGAKQWIILAAHWDTRPVADMEVNASKRAKPILGANDGASGVAVLLELARLFAQRQPKVGVMMVFFDGEDYTPNPPTVRGHVPGVEVLRESSRRQDQSSGEIRYSAGHDRG